MGQVPGRLAAAIIVGVVMLVGLVAWKYLSPAGRSGPDKPGPNLDSVKQQMFGSQSPGKK